MAGFAAIVSHRADLFVQVRFGEASYQIRRVKDAEGCPRQRRVEPWCQCALVQYQHLRDAICQHHVFRIVF